MIDDQSRILSYVDGGGCSHNRAGNASEPEECMEPHRHSQLEIIFVQEGEYLFKSGNLEGVLRAGDVFISNRDELHSGLCLFTKARNRYRYLQIDVDCLIEQLNPNFGKLISSEVLYHRYIKADEAEKSGLWVHGNRLLNIILRRDSRDDIEKLGQMLLFLNVLNVHRKAEVRRGLQRTDFVTRVEEYVDRFYDERITVERISDALGYEKSYFCRKMQREFGKTFSHYLRAVRLNKFCTHPALSLQNISQCAQDVGYNDYAYFYQSFRKAYKMSPREYLLRRAHKVSKH